MRTTRGARRRSKRGLPGASESSIQRAILAFVRLQYPRVLAVHVANGGFVMDPRVMGRLKGEGLTPGFPDLSFYWPGGHGLMEVKSARGQLSEEQAAIIALLRRLGHKVEVVRGADEVATIFDEWGVPKGRADDSHAGELFAA